MRILLTITFLCLGLAAPSSVVADQFTEIKARLAESNCTRFEFRSILFSSIFKQTDTSRGTAYIARDGRYRINLGPDQYVNDGSYLYSYSPSSNQVVMQKADSTTAFSKEVSYLTRLDEFFKTIILKANSEYRLIKLTDRMQNLPDSMNLVINKKARTIERIEYFDINDEKVRIEFLKQTTGSECDDKQLAPDFPDSAERVKL
ncbi:MAG: outer membrane lipoprotein carrier protein LolA [Candidatus Zixiibacteriota bacterium]